MQYYWNIKYTLWVGCQLHQPYSNMLKKFKTKIFSQAALLNFLQMP